MTTTSDLGLPGVLRFLARARGDVHAELGEPVRRAGGWDRYELASIGEMWLSYLDGDVGDIELHGPGIAARAAAELELPDGWSLNPVRDDLARIESEAFERHFEIQFRAGWAELTTAALHQEGIPWELVATGPDNRVLELRLPAHHATPEMACRATEGLLPTVSSADRRLAFYRLVGRGPDGRQLSSRELA